MSHRTVSDTVLVPGGRDVRATLDVAETTTSDDGSPAVNATNAVVVACPPHPQHRGHRGDERLVAVSDALTSLGIDCLRFDYGPWDEGYGECADADNAVGWALGRYDRVGLFGFSFGGTVALVTAAARPAVAAVCALAPTARLNPEADATDALADLAVRASRTADESNAGDGARTGPSTGDNAGTGASGPPVTVVYATRDSTADWEPVVDRAEALGIRAVPIESDHFLIGRASEVAETVADALVPWLRT